MKDSGVKWIGEIPEGWKKKHIGSFYHLRNTKVSDIEYPPLSVTMKGIVPQLENAAKTNDHNNRKLVKKGDFVINSRSDRKGACGISDYNGSVSLINTVLMPTEQMNPVYYNWLFHSNCFGDEFYKWGHGIVDDLWTTTWQDMKKITVPVPSMEEQQAIADFLDAKCSELDALAADIRSQIDTLKEYKKSLITQVVTKGLNPQGEMKDSGIEWIGEISSEASIHRLKYDTYMKGRIGWQGLKSKDFIEKGPYCVTSTDFIDGHINWNTCYHVSLKRYNMDPYIQIKEGDLLISKDGTIGKLALVDTLPNKACLNSHLLIIRPLTSKYITKYLYYVLQSDIFTNYYKIVGSGSTMQSLSQEKLGQFCFTIWELPTQRKIADFLDAKCSELDSLISAKEQQLASLADYKKSLIYQYVTGKKQVPGNKEDKKAKNSPR